MVPHPPHHAPLDMWSAPLAFYIHAAQLEGAHYLYTKNGTKNMSFVAHMHTCGIGSKNLTTQDISVDLVLHCPSIFDEDIHTLKHRSVTH